MDCVASPRGARGRLAAAGAVFGDPLTPIARRGLRGVVKVTGANRHVLQAAAGATGNFYLPGPSPSPSTPRSPTTAGPGRWSPPAAADCAGCHTRAGLNGAPGRIIAPSQPPGDQPPQAGSPPVPRAPPGLGSAPGSSERSAASGPARAGSRAPLRGPPLLRAAGVGVAAVAGYWVLESAVHAFVLHRGTFAEALRPSSGNELWMRGLIAALLLLVSALVFLRPAPRPPEDVALLGRVVEAASEGVLIADALGRIQYVNPAFTRITGYALAEVVGRTPAVLKSGAMNPPFYRGLSDTIRRAGVGGRPHRPAPGRALLPAVLTIVPVPDPQG